MEHETLFTATKWDILKLLEKKPLSPLEIAKLSGSSLANVSQQLRLLEMAGLVTSRRIVNRDKDKPRILYSIAGNLSYLIAASDNFVDKRLLTLSDRNKVVLRIWFIEDQAVRYALENAFWQIEPRLDSIDVLTYAGTEKGRPVIEYSGTAKIASNISVGSSHTPVIVRQSKAPKGHVLYERKA